VPPERLVFTWGALDGRPRIDPTEPEFDDRLRASTVVDAEPAGKLNSSCMAEV
jgi:hypothetical protein